MIPNNYKTSLVIPSQLPEFVKDDVNYETFVAFVKAYYEWMELADTSNANTSIVSTTHQGVLTGSKNIINYSDVDSTIDGFIDYFIQDFLPYFPQSSLADKSKTLKIAKQLYQTKGTPSSYEFLFRLLYNSWVGIAETGEQVFRPSDGQWYIPKYLKVKADNENLLSEGLRGLRIFGETSKSFAVIDTVILDVDKYNVYISNIERVFLSGELIRVVDIDNQDVYVKNGKVVSSNTSGSSKVTGELVGSVNTITIDPTRRGLNYNPGDPVVVYGGLNSVLGTGAKAVVAETTKGSIGKLTVLNGGAGYRAGNTTTSNVTSYQNTSISFSPSSGIVAHAETFDTANLALVSSVITNNVNAQSAKTLGTQVKCGSFIVGNSYVIFSTGNTNFTIIGAANNNVGTTFTANSTGSAYASTTGTAWRLNYNLLSYSFSKLPTANIKTKISDAMNVVSFSTYPISFVTLDNGGSGISTDPSISVVSNYYDLDGQPKNLYNVGILGPIHILKGGSGYVANDKITITGGTGVGAQANVLTVNGTGAITSVEYVDYLNVSGKYPKGGMGYTRSDVDGTNINRPLTLSISSSLGAGAELDVHDVLGSGLTLDISRDRIGSINKINVTSTGVDYVSTPSVSLKVQDLAVSGFDSTTTISRLEPGTLIFQGGDPLDTNQSLYHSYVDSIELLQQGDVIANNIYKIRVYNNYSTPSLYSSSDPANTMIYIDVYPQPYPTINLNSSLDSVLGFTNGFKSYGDGTAKATASFTNSLNYGQGQYLNTKGQPSSFSLLQSKDINDYTYQVSVENAISEYRDVLKRLLHPAGMNVLGREVLNNSKRFGINWSSTLANNYPMVHFNSNATVNVAADFTNTSTNIVTFSGLDSANLATFVSANQRFFCARNGMNVYNKILSTDYANLKITLYTSIFLTYNNVAYGYANSGSNTINITSNTANYGQFINNNEWSYEAQNANNVLIDIIFAGDKLKMNNIVYTVESVYYANTANNPSDITTITLSNNIVSNTGTFSNPVLLSINRNVVNDSNVIIYTIN